MNQGARPREILQAFAMGENSLYRQKIVALLFFSTFINFLDRQTLSIAAPILLDHLSLSRIDYSRIVSAFLLGYTLSQTFAGKLIDRTGTRSGLFFCVALWSTAAMLHGVAIGFLSLAFARLLLGIAEAGNWPGAVKAISENFPPRHYALAVGVFHSGSFAGAVAAAPIIVTLVHFWGWRWMFVLVGATGFVWVLIWAKFYPKKPFLQANVSPRAGGPPAPLLTYLRRKTVWGLMIGRALADPVWWFYVFWLPDYLAQSRGFAFSTIGAMLWIPFTFGALGSGAGGYVSGILIAQGRSPVVARKVIMVFGAGLMLFGIPAFLAPNSIAVIALICVVLFGYGSWSANFLSLAADLFPSEEVAGVTGLSGTAGAIGGVLFTLLTGWLVQNVSYAPVFVLASTMMVCAAGAVLLLVSHQARREAVLGRPGAIGPDC